MGANEVSAILWRERELLELLLFKLEEEQLLLTAGKARWLSHATREVEQVLERLRDSGLNRAIEVAALAEEWGAGSDASLRELVTHAPEGPWGEIFDNHLRAMTELTAEIQQLRDLNEQFLRSALRSTQETLASLSPDAGTYDSSGTASSGADARLIDKRL
ncbi:FlgN protein [Homoserinimonas aerilata]|uniref:FlgN protein n=1 Tax=Homoserinimonas aerilata TaxID=1162970 RepID=A0A542YEV1_9MICO|nr:flagellar export chaperone FlgN [Homoserinimonas aerilata]TQL46602.1 FlgN protein [Homoserinimonas aerilata]